MSRPWKHSVSGWTEVWATWSRWICPCSLQGHWIRRALKVLSNTNYFMILWKQQFLYSQVAVQLLLFYLTAHQNFREKICPLSQHILLKDNNSLSPPSNPCLLFIFASFICCKDIEHNHSKVCVQWKWFPCRTLILNIFVLHFCASFFYFAFDQYVMYWFTVLRLFPLLRRLLWVC